MPVNIKVDRGLGNILLLLLPFVEGVSTVVHWFFSWWGGLPAVCPSLWWSAQGSSCCWYIIPDDSW